MVRDLVAQYCAIPRDYLSDTPLLRAMGFLVSQHGQLGAIPPTPFWASPPWRAFEVEVGYPPPLKRVSQRYLRDTLWIQGKASAILSRKGIARYGGVSRTGPLGSEREGHLHVLSEGARTPNQGGWLKILGNKAEHRVFCVIEWEVAQRNICILKIDFLVQRPLGEEGVFPRRGGGRKVRALPPKFVFLGFRREESGMSREFCGDVPDFWGCSQSLCKKSSCAFFVPYYKHSVLTKFGFLSVHFFQDGPYLRKMLLKPQERLFKLQKWKNGHSEPLRLEA